VVAWMVTSRRPHLRAEQGVFKIDVELEVFPLGF
jgi:hypothetical protein